MIDVVTRSPLETRQLGELIGSTLDAPMTFALIGDLGSGKTIFTQGLANGLGIPGESEVTSPSFTLIHEHRGRFDLYHVDLYRLENEGRLEDLGLDDILDHQSVVAVEWAEKLHESSLSDHVEVRIQFRSDKERRIDILPKGEKSAVFLQKIRKMIFTRNACTQ